MKKEPFKVSLSIDGLEVSDEVLDNHLAIIEVYVCHDGNNAHNLPIKLDTMFKPVFLDAKTIAIEHQFSIKAKNCVDGVENFVKNNLERLVEEAIEIRRRHN